MAAETEATTVAETTESEAKKRLGLDVNVENVSACERHVTVTIARDDVDRYLKKTLSDLRGKAEIPGFRPGRAPRKLVESRFKDQVRDQVKSSLLMDSMGQISEDNVFTAIGEPDLDVDAVVLPDDGPMKFEFNIEVRPEFDLPSWQGLSLNRPAFDITDEQVEQRLVAIGRFGVSNTEVEGPIKSADMLTGELVVTHEGQEILRSTQTLKAVNTISFPDSVWTGFEALVVGKAAGDTVSSKLLLGEGAQKEALRGKEVEVSFAIAKVERRTVNDLLPQDLSSYGFEEMGEVRQLVRQSLERQRDFFQKQALRKQITEKLTVGASWDLPPAMLRRQSRRELDRKIIELRRGGFTDDQIRSHINSLSQNSMQETSRALKEHFILERMAEEQKVEATDADYSTEIELIAEQSGESPRRLLARMQKSGQMDSLRNHIIERKVVELIQAEATITDVPEPYPWANTDLAYALDVSLDGSSEQNSIPEAKHAGGGEEPLPNTAEKR
ncbi:MAG: trigger factor [Planctomycetota bacterium]